LCAREPTDRPTRPRAKIEEPHFSPIVARFLNRFRRLKIRYEHRADIHPAFLQLGCALISLHFLG
jgi:hypothetical protein